MGSRRDRYREIVQTLSVHGFGFTIGAMGLQGRFPFRRGLPGHQQGRTYTQPEHLRLALEQLGPTFVKLGQLLSTRSDLLPSEYTVELAKLQDDTAAVPANVILEALSEEVGDPGVFDRFDHEPLASASIGQAHAASSAQPCRPLRSCGRGQGQHATLAKRPGRQMLDRQAGSRAPKGGPCTWVSS